MTSVISAGFGNIAADTTLEKIYCIFILMMGGILYAAILGNVTNILQQISNKHQDFHDQMKSIRDFASLYELPPILSERICDYVSFTRVISHGIDEEAVLSLLPEYKRSEICVHMHRRLLLSQPIFTSLDESGLQHVARRLERVCLAPGEIVCDRDELVDCVYFIMGGNVEVVWEGMLVGLLTKGDTFGVDVWGESGGRKSGVMVKALTYVDIDVISGENLDEVAKTLPSIKSLFEHKVQLTFSVANELNLRSMESVQWERDAATNPQVAKKVKRLKRWRNKIQVRKQRSETIENDPCRGSPVFSTGEETNEKSTWEMLKTRTERAMKSIRWSLKVCTLIHGGGYLARQQVRKPLKEVPIKPKHCRKCGKKDGRPTKLKQNKVFPKKEKIQVKLEALKQLELMEDLRDKYEDDSLISAPCYNVVEVGGEATLEKCGVVRFTLEGRVWEGMQLPVGAKQALNSFLQFKTNVERDLNETDKKLSLIENLIGDILLKLEKESTYSYN